MSGGSTGAPPAGSVILRGDLFFREFKENLRKICFLFSAIGVLYQREDAAGRIRRQNRQ